LICKTDSVYIQNVLLDFIFFNF